MAKPLLFVADYNGYANPFLQTFNLTENIKDAHCLMFTGGEDVNPATYGDSVGARTYFTPERDRYELEFFNIAKARDIPIIGICRGHQLLCALSGGKLIQHCTGHIGTHGIITDNGEHYEMTSLHHQMVRLENTGAYLIAWADQPRSRQYLDGEDNEIYGHERADNEGMDGGSSISTHVEPEIVYWSKVKGLGIQGHPEMMRREHPTVQYCNRLVKEYLFGEQATTKAA